MLLAGALGPAEAVAAEFLPVVTNFSARQYNGQLQNWHATQLPSGTMCFANGDGVLTFDGHTWQKHKLPVDYIVRSVMSDGDRLYVGSFEEFGYFTRKKNGFTAYTSLSSQLGKGSFNNDEFWGILKIGSKIYFQSFEKAYAFDTATEKLTPLPSTFVNKPQDIKFRPLYLFNHRGTLKAQAIGAGLCRLGNGGWIEETPLDEAGSYIVAIIGDIAVTEAHGLRQIAPDGRLLPFPTDADSQLLSYRINRAAAGSTGQLYIGTIGGGVFALSPDGHLLWHISTTHGGLCNNSVLGLHNDYRGNLWVCLDDGISLIHTGKPFTMLQPEGGSADIGMVYGIGTDTNGNIYVAANQGAYRYDRQSNNKAFSLIPATRGQNWFVRRFDNQLFIGNNDKTIEIMPDGSARKIAGTATDMKKGTIQNQDVIIQSSYYEFHTYTRTGNRWAPHSTLQGFGAPVRQVEIAPDGTVWATHMTRGVIRARINSTLDRFNDIKTFESLDGDTIPRMCYILKIRGSIYFSDDHHLYQYNESDDRFEISRKIEEDLHWVKQPRSVTRVNDNQFWIATADACHLVEFFRG